MLEAIIISFAKDETFRDVTQQAIDSLLSSQRNVKCIATVIESNKECKPYDSAKTIYPDTPFGYNHYLNIGIKQSKADYVALCNNDLMFTPGWADNITRAMELFELQSASPLCPLFHGPKSIHAFNGADPLFQSNKVLFGYRVARHVAGWCIVAKREMLEQIGYLDEDFKFWYADNSYAAQIASKGIPHGLVLNSIVHHLHGGSNTLNTESPSKQKLLMGGGALFAKKYGHIDLGK
jgi:GT2 family glycosyltransferase